MKFLLKIVQGPNAGAEIALVEGVRVTLGSADSCDIVLADPTLPAEACAIEASADSVALTPSGAEPETLAPLQVRSFGSTALAVGPADSPWGPLNWDAPAAEGSPAGDREEERPESAPAKEADAEVTDRPATEPAADSPLGRLLANARRNGAGEDAQGAPIMWTGYTPPEAPLPPYSAVPSGVTAEDLLPAMTAGFVRRVNDDLLDIFVYDRRREFRRVNIPMNHLEKAVHVAVHFFLVRHPFFQRLNLCFQVLLFFFVSLCHFYITLTAEIPEYGVLITAGDQRIQIGNAFLRLF